MRLERVLKKGTYKGYVMKNLVFDSCANILEFNLNIIYD